MPCEAFTEVRRVEQFLNQRFVGDGRVDGPLLQKLRSLSGRRRQAREHDGQPTEQHVRLSDRGRL